jgi:UDP-2,3-diacylglucosamine pyrophosphatase LpxH
MLVAISDIHFVDGTAGEHNLPFSAFKSVFLSDVASLAKEKNAKEVKLLLLGDMVDVIRSTKWFDVDPEDRPWGTRGLKDIPSPPKRSTTEKQCLKVLGRVTQRSMAEEEPPDSLPKDTILYKNWKTFKLLRELEEHLAEWCGRRIPVQIIYVPGNHDRLCNLYPSVRDALRDMLGLTVTHDSVDGDPDSEWWYRYIYGDRDHGVYAMHGHQYDVWNFGGGNDRGRDGHLQVPIGDVFTTEFAVKIPWMLDSLRKKYPGITKELVESTKDIDNVRPLSSVMEWIYYRLKKDDHGTIREAFDEVFDRVIKELLDNKLVSQWRSPHTHIDEALRLASSRWLSWLPKGLVDALDAEDLLPLVMGMTGGPDDPEKDPYTIAAYSESIWRENRDIQFILYGHTHMPVQRALDGQGGREVFYINTGTWRTRIHKTIGLDKAPDFADLKQMTYTIIYRKDEDTRGKEPQTLSFDIWTGTKKKHYS